MMISRPLIFWTLFIGVAGFLVTLLSPIIGPFLLGWLLAYALNPLVAILQRWRCSRLWAIMIVFTLAVSTVLVLIQITVPLLVQECLALSQHLPENITYFVQKLWSPMHDWSQTVSLWKDFNVGQFVHDSMGTIVQGFSQIMQHVFSGGQTLVGFLWVLLLTPLSTFYFLKDWSVVLETLQRWLPRAYEPTICMYVRRVHQSLAHFIRGQVSVCILSALGHTLGLWLVHLEGAVLIGTLSGLLAFIPYGALTLGMLISVVACALQFGTLQACLMVVMVFVVVHLVESNILVPKLVGAEMGIHPLWMIFIFFASAELFGFWGILFALPLAACLKILFQMLLETYMRSLYYKSIA